MFECYSTDGVIQLINVSDFYCLGLEMENLVPFIWSKLLRIARIGAYITSSKNIHYKISRSSLIQKETLASLVVSEAVLLLRLPLLIALDSWYGSRIISSVASCKTVNEPEE